ncbi:MAG: hypothetical protein COA44_11230 [Arcobacter sp.]|nr:MAG: hypothetical protein COA44_11230 [Arcobacter sp.]
MLATHEKRRKEPSYTIPFLYEILELALIWIFFSLIEGTTNITQWGLLSYSGSSVWFIYTFYKLKRVLNRQIVHKH